MERIVRDQINLAKIIIIAWVLGHPLKEIRERSLQLLLAKMQLGWEFEEELANTRELLESLLVWFHVQQPTLQQEALSLLLTIIKVSMLCVVELLKNLYFFIKYILLKSNKLKNTNATSLLARFVLLDKMYYLCGIICGIWLRGAFSLH